MPQSLSRVVLHLVFSTKDRRPFLSPEIQTELFPYVVGTLRSEGCFPIRTGGMPDHVHILFGLSRTITIAKAVERVKSGSSKWLKGRWSACSEFAWQEGYGAFSVGYKETDEVVAYILNQAEHHRKRGFQDEFRELMNLNGVEFDEKYVWD